MKQYKAQWRAIRKSNSSTKLVAQIGTKN